MYKAFYNKHYITVRQDGVITDAWSDGPHREKDTAGAICINDKGGYQFRLILDGKQTEENPTMRTMDGILLYKWDGFKVVLRTEDELAADRAAIQYRLQTYMSKLTQEEYNSIIEEKESDT